MISIVLTPILALLIVWLWARKNHPAAFLCGDGRPRPSRISRHLRVWRTWARTHAPNSSRDPDGRGGRRHTDPGDFSQPLSRERQATTARIRDKKDINDENVSRQGQRMMGPSEETEPSVDLRRFAATVFALAVARGALYSVKNGDLREDELSEVLTGTSSVHIAQTLALAEESLVVDWEQYLTPEEREAIRSGQLAGLRRE